MSRNNGMVWIAGLAGIALAGAPAFAMTPKPLGASPSLVLPVMDEEDKTVEEDLRPDEVPTTKSGREMVPAPERAEGGNVEDEEVKRDLETGD